MELYLQSWWSSNTSLCTSNIPATHIDTKCAPLGFVYICSYSSKPFLGSVCTNGTCALTHIYNMDNALWDM